MKEDYSITKQMQEDLIEAYKRVAPTSWTQEDAYIKTVKQPAKRYYVSGKQAAEKISRMIRGDFEIVDLMGANKRRMYYSLFEKVMELSEKPAFAGKSLCFVCAFAVLEPAPEFFISPSSVERIRLCIKRGLVDDTGRTTPSGSYIRSYEKLKEKRRILKEYRESVRNSLLKERGSLSAS